MNQYPVDILICLNALFTMEYYKKDYDGVEPVSDAEYDQAITALTKVSDTMWDKLNYVIEVSEPGVMRAVKNLYVKVEGMVWREVNR